ncbi:Duplicated homeodomain-like superfamily protein [Raphanus sativus]|nr:Duplicated homeodomain-like superfamily protein [Raphanus sativus]
MLVGSNQDVSHFLLTVVILLRMLVVVTMEEEGAVRKEVATTVMIREAKQRLIKNDERVLPGSEDEHRLFLLGLDKYGKGDWRSISRNFVVTRTPTQVASHAQKYFIRLNSMNKDRRRSSIHDITSVGDADVSTPQGPITGQNNNTTTGSAPVAGGGNKSVKQAASQPPPGPPMYGTPTVGQPVGGPLVSAVGTPVNLPAPPHMAYGVHAASVPGSVVPGAPMNMAQMPYTMPRTPTAHR